MCTSIEDSIGRAHVMMVSGDADNVLDSSLEQRKMKSRFVGELRGSVMESDKGFDDVTFLDPFSIDFNPVLFLHLDPRDMRKLLSVRTIC